MLDPLSNIIELIGKTKKKDHFVRCGRNEITEEINLIILHIHRLNEIFGHSRPILHFLRFSFIFIYFHDSYIYT